MAALIPNETVKEIQRAADIVDVVSKRVLLKKAGKNFIGLCPFHTEKTPSFSVNPEKKIFYCFGCGSGGDIFNFLMKLDGLSFPEAVHHVASLYGIDILKDTAVSSTQVNFSEKDNSYKINRIAASFFHDCLHKPRIGAKAMSYLQGRGMTLEIIKAFNLGYAPPGWDNLSRFLIRQRNMSVDLIEKAGLVVQRKDGKGHYDRFRDRIIFPIYDRSRRIIAFGGRVMDDSLPKYLNSPETSIYHKSKSLYGVHTAQQKCRAAGRVYLVEGYFDLIALNLYGIENSVATLGTALTREHVQILRGLVGDAGKAILVYDSDEAGVRAAQRSIDVFEAGFLEVQILILPSGYDPDVYIRRYGRQKFLELSENALDVMLFLLESAIRQYGLSVEGKLRIIQKLTLPLINLSDVVARTLYVRTIAERLDIEENAILEKIRRVAQQRFSQRFSGDEVSPENAKITSELDGLNKRSRIEHKLVAMMLSSSDLIAEIAKRNIVDQIQNRVMKRIATLVLESDANDDDDMVGSLLAQIESDDIKRVVASLAISEEKWDIAGCQKLITQFEQSIRRGGDDLLQKIKEAEKNNDIETLEKLLLIKQMKTKEFRQHS